MDIPEFKITIGNYNSTIHFDINQWNETKHRFDVILFNDLDDNYREFVLNMMYKLCLHLFKSI